MILQLRTGVLQYDTMMFFNGSDDQSGIAKIHTQIFGQFWSRIHPLENLLEAFMNPHT
jgi:hypothetical protein